MNPDHNLDSEGEEEAGGKEVWLLAREEPVN